MLSQDTTADSKKNPHLVESLTIGNSSIKMQNRILNNKSTLGSDAKSIGESTPAHQHKYKSIDFGTEEQAKSSSVVVAGNSNITPKAHNHSNADKSSIITQANSIARKSALDMIEEGNSQSKREGEQSDDDEMPNQILAVSGKQQANRNAKNASNLASDHKAEVSLMVDESRNYKNHSTLGTIADKNKDLRVKKLLQKNRSNANASVVNFNGST